MKLSDKLKNCAQETLYQKVAKEFDVSAKFVGMIARGERRAIRGKGFLIKKRLEEIASKKK